MIDFLKEYGIDDISINNIKNNNSESTLFDLSCNKDNCINLINYMKNIGIMNIEELLTYEIDIFFVDYNKLLSKISNYNINEIVRLINSDYNNIDLLYNIIN